MVAAPIVINPGLSLRDISAIDLLRHLERRAGLVLPDQDRLAAATKSQALRARAFAFREGEPCARLFVVRSGLLKQFHTGHDGAEWVKSFTGPGDLFACPHALSGGPARFSSQAIEPSRVQSVDWGVIESLGEAHPAWQKAIRLGFQWLAQRKVERERDLLMLKPRDLYAGLLAASPDWFERIPQKDLAAYLGVTAVGLNRIIRRSRREAADGA